MPLIDCITRAGKALPKAIADDLMERHDKLVEAGYTTERAAQEALGIVRQESVRDLDTMLNQLGLKRPELVSQQTLAERAITRIEGMENAIRQGTYSDPFLLTPFALAVLKAAKLSIKAGQKVAEAVRAAIQSVRSQMPDAADSDRDVEQALVKALTLPERQHAQKIEAATDVSPAIKELIGNRTYQIMPEHEAERQARAVIERVGGVTEAMLAFADRNNGMHEAVRTKLGTLILKESAGAEQRARAAGKVAEADAIAEAAARFIDQQVLPRSTEVAQALQAFADFGSLTPAGHVRYYKRILSQAQEAAQRRFGTLSNWIADQMRKANEWTLGQMVGDRGFQDAVRTAIDQTIADSPEVQDGIRKEVADEFGSMGPMVDDHYSGKQPGTLEDKLAQQGVPDPKGTAAKIEKRWREGVDNRKRTIRQRIAAQRRGALATTDLDTLIRRKLTMLRMKLSEVVKRHYLEQAATGRRIADALVQDAGLTGSAAQMLAASIQARFTKLATARKQAILTRLTTPQAKRFVAKGVADRIIEFSNLGGFSQEQFWSAIAEKFGLPAYNSATAAEIVKRSNALQLLPEGSVQRLQATQELMNFIAKTKGVDVADLAWSFWYANTLSGPLTHFVNALSNAQSLALNLGVSMVRHPTEVPRILESAANGFRQGMSEAANTLRTGFSAVKGDKVEAQGALELKQWTGWAKPLNAWKYVGRALAAADVAFYMPAREAQAATLARTIAKAEGLSGNALEVRVSQLLGLRDQAGNDLRAEAEAMALVEAGDLENVGQRPDANWRARRIAQILDRGRLPELREQAHQYALRATFNNKPYGLLGVVAEAFNHARRNSKAINFVVPFVNVVANVTNESLNYTPVGTFRAILGHGGQVGNWRFGGELYGRPATATDVADLHAKAALGTALLGGLVALAAEGVGHEDDDERFQLYGAGPDDAAKRNQLRETGWIPYSIRLGGKWYSYGNSPLAIPLSIGGNYLDATRYGKLDKVDALDRVGWAILEAGHVITQQSFLDSASGLFGALDRNSPNRSADRILQEASRSATSFVVPNALRQIDRMFDPKVYDSTGVQGALVSGIPFVRAMNRPALNALGEPVSRSPMARLLSAEGGDRLWKVMAAKQAWVTVPSARDGLTPDNVYEITAKRGPMLRAQLEAALPAIQRLDNEQARKLVLRISESATKSAEAQLKLLPSQRKAAERAAGK